jgi:putative aminopeptidase FrvX
VQAAAFVVGIPTRLTSLGFGYNDLPEYSEGSEAMTDETLQMLQELTDAPGVSGFEEPVRRVMRRHLEPLGDILTDNLGSIIGRKVGLAGGPRVVLAGHLDEIGFMVTRVTDEGYLKFQTLGGWWEQVMLAQRVEVYTRNGRFPGVIGSKPPHILTPEERNKVYDRKQMFIDIGAASKAEVEEWGIRPGDPVVPVCSFQPMHNPDLLLAKAWDNRFGCGLAIEVLRQLQSERHPNEVYAVGNVQEEVGLRGATTTTNLIAPDVAFAFDTGIAGDTPGIGPDEAAGKLGHGPVILLYDGSMIPHVGLRDLVIDTAREAGLPLQFDKMPGGGTDAGKMHVFGHGVPSLVIGVPVRYIHTNAAIMHRADFDLAVQLVVAVVKRLDADTVQQLKA